MMNYHEKTLKEYLDVLAAKTPVPGGGSAASLVGALGAALISMVAQYSLGKNKPPSIEKKIEDILLQSESIRGRFLELVDLDAEAYLNVVKSRKADPEVKKEALRKAREVPMEVCRLCFQAVTLTPFLVKNGNQFLLSDVRVALEMLLAAFNASLVNVEINQ